MCTLASDGLRVCGNLARPRPPQVPGCDRCDPKCHFSLDLIIFSLHSEKVSFSFRQNLFLQKTLEKVPKDTLKSKSNRPRQCAHVHVRISMWRTGFYEKLYAADPGPASLALLLL